MADPEPKAMIQSKRIGLKRTKQYYAKFIATNGKVLAHTEYYYNRIDLHTILAQYFPEFKVEDHS